jgi:PIN domain nuclease of toxin-antitoxin system
MPVLDTVVLFAVADKEDKFHRSAMQYMSKLSEESYWLAAFALFEFDIVTKSRGISFDQRMERYATLIKDFPAISEKTLNIGAKTLFLTAKLEKEESLEYFDAGIASESLQKDGTVVSTDRVFDKIPSLKRVWRNETEIGVKNKKIK